MGMGKASGAAWAARGLNLAFALFLSIFAADVFEEHFGLWRTVAALSMHLIPTFLLLILLALAWRWPLVGAAGNAGLALAWMALIHGRHFPFVTYALMAGPLFLTSTLYVIAWRSPGVPPSAFTSSRST